MILDIHTHCLEAADALIAVEPRAFTPLQGKHYAVGFHPWSEVSSLSDADYQLLERCANHPQVVAIGEIGLDALRGDRLEAQQQALCRQLRIASQLGLPVVAHSVRTANQLIACWRACASQGIKLAVHGMRSNERVAKMLIDEGFFLSFGTHFQESTVRYTPLDRLLIETDDTPPPTTIHTVASHIGKCVGMDAEEVESLARANAARFLSPSKSLEQ